MHVLTRQQAALSAPLQRQQRRRIDRLTADQHPEEQVHAVGHAAVPDHADALAGFYPCLSGGERGREAAEMGVDADKAVVLFEDRSTFSVGSVSSMFSNRALLRRANLIEATEEEVLP